MKLDSIHEKLSEDKTGNINSKTNVEYFDQLLGSVSFRSSTSEPIGINFPQDSSSAYRQPYDTDTDNEDIDGLAAVKLGKKRKKPYNASKLLYAKKGELTNNYLEQGDDYGELSPERYSNKLCCDLALDALRIVEKHPREQTRNRTVCLFVILRDKDGYAKKFVFHNGVSSLSTPMREQAEHLKYHIIHAERAHAEGAFVQFLLKRNTGALGEAYTHLIGMGCSRQHCKERNSLLKLALGEEYHKFTASIKDDKRVKQNEVNISVSQNGNEVTIDRHQKTTAEILHGEGASSEKYFRKFALGEFLASWIEKITGIKIPPKNRYSNVDGT